VPEPWSRISRLSGFGQGGWAPPHGATTFPGTNAAFGHSRAPQPGAQPTLISRDRGPTAIDTATGNSNSSSTATHMRRQQVDDSDGTHSEEASRAIAPTPSLRHADGRIVRRAGSDMGNRASSLSLLILGPLLFGKPGTVLLVILLPVALGELPWWPSIWRANGGGKVAFHSSHGTLAGRNDFLKSPQPAELSRGDRRTDYQIALRHWRHKPTSFEHSRQTIAPPARPGSRRRTFDRSRSWLRRLTTPDGIMRDGNPRDATVEMNRGKIATGQRRVFPHE